MNDSQNPSSAVSRGSFAEVFRVALRLGLTSFGGPIAHLGYFHEEYVRRRQWLDERSYADLVALCQFLPGPASSQVGMAIGIARAGLPGALAAWLGFTLPSALALTLFALGLGALGDPGNAGWLHGLKLAAVAVVIQAIWSMARALCPDRARASLAILAAVVTLAWPGAAAQVATIAIAGIIGWSTLRSAPGNAGAAPTHFPVGKRAALCALALCFFLLLVLPIARQFNADETLALIDSFYRAGSLVFGGGHVVLPLLQAEVVRPGWLDDQQFIAGYGAAQAVPGPLFTFSAYLGAVIAGWRGALLALIAIFLPSFLLIVGALPFWQRLRGMASIQAALAGVNAAVVGLLLAALYHPIWTGAIFNAVDFSIALIAFGLLSFWRWPPWLIVALAAAAGDLVTRL